MTAKQGWILAGVVAALVIGAFLLGRGTVKPEVRSVDRVVYKDRVVEVVKEVKVAAEAKRVVIYRDRVVKPDGTRVEHEVERTDTDTKVTTSKEGTKTSTTEGTKVAEHSVTAKPDWRVGVLAGASLREPLIPVYGPLVLGAYVERRILGPFSVGAWGLTSGAAGLSLSVEF